MNATKGDGTEPTGGTIIHIGAGECRQCSEYLVAEAERILLVEPNPQRAKELVRRTEDDEHIEVREVAVTDDPTRNRLQVFNLADVSSLRTPTAAHQLFPGLKTTAEIEVETITPADLFAGEALSAGQGNRLIMDAPGEEAAIVEALQSTKTLTSFDRIDLHCGRAPLFEGGEPAEVLLNWLAADGHEIEECDDEADPDRPVWRLRLHPLQLKNQALRQQLAKLEKQITDLTKARDERAQEADQRKQALEALQQEKEGLEKKVAELEQQAMEVTTAQEAEQGKQALEALQQEKEGLETKVAELEQQSTELATSRDEQAKLAEERRQEIDRLTSERDEANKAAEESLRKDLSLAHKNLAIKDSDLRDLQSRYGDLLEEKKKQDQLLGELAQRLGVAADYLHRLQEEGDEAEIRSHLLGSGEGKSMDAGSDEQ